MPKYKIRGTNETVVLDKDTFRAAGGEGAIHVVGDTAYKICNPGMMIPEAKVTELSVLNHPKIINPKKLLDDSRGRPVGYTMNAVPGKAVPLAEILSKTFREREGVTPAMMANLVLQIMDGLRSIHKHPGYLQVDGNEYNYMVSGDFKDIYFVDVNSFQTPHYPADAIMASIRDYSVGRDGNGVFQWTTLSDFYSAAIISFYMFTGIHPFKCRHPKFPNIKTSMVDQMMAGISILDSESRFPEAAVYFPFENFIPGGANGAWMQYYRAILVDRKRLAPPLDYQGALQIAAKVMEIVGSNNFKIKELRDYVSRITGYFEHNGRDVVVTANHVYVNGQQQQRPSPRFRVGFTGHTPVAAWLNDNDLQLFNLESKVEIPCQLAGREVMAYKGQIYVLGEKDIFELDFIPAKNNFVVGTRVVANVMPHATKLYQGVAVQDMFGVRMVSIFPEQGFHRPVKINELAGIKITEAKYEGHVGDKNEGHVLMVIGLDEKSGEYNRYIFRFATDWESYDVRIVENITPIGINFTVLSNGICVCLTENENIELFSSRKDSVGLKSIDDPAIKADMRLCHSGTQVQFAHGHKMYSISMS